MRLIGLMPVRNEEWCLGFTLRVALKWCDEVVVFCHACTDDSPFIAAEIGKESGGRVTVIGDPRESWDEMRHRQALLESARAMGATHIAMIDADEFLTANALVGIRGLVANTRPGWMLDLPLYNCRERDTASAFAYERWKNYHSNGVWGNRWVATTFTDRPELNWCGEGYHHREPFGAEWRGRHARPLSQGEGGTLHLWGASERRLIAKHQAYKMGERLKWPNKPAAEIEYTYDPATNPNSVLAQRMNVAGPWTFAPVKPEWLLGYEDLAQYLHIDAVPWQEDHVRSLLRTYGKETFAGLNLFGLENE